ncbi:agip29 [Agrotis ipsilon multiple nucleopolyhedrovirus]|uniref:GIY-YIG domain-containing protein n=1 Tax=Agrotis ipsilon multiple nucleopolyhedrovirus TaxID=208013 RepID=B6D5U3_9ABAC|nr:agip29 [Agrotis ipsilon multiple nucleopolyhedrovirus]ACI28731.1 unknown [Agrotis ipsilon multiple nucleopolyhedrovirus]
MNNNWCLYIVRAVSQQSSKEYILYTGITKDPNRRFGQHCRGTGAKCLRRSATLELVYVSPPIYTHRRVARAEYRLKRKPKKFKEWIVATKPHNIVEMLGT